MRVLRNVSLKNKVVIDDVLKKKSKKKPVYFNSIFIKNITPTNDSIDAGVFIEIIYKNKPLWALFKCPCGCQYVITLPLQKTHGPSWTVTVSEMGRPTLFPSVWQNKGCFSHFWIEDGIVYWCNNTGTVPWLKKSFHNHE